MSNYKHDCDDNRPGFAPADNDTVKYPMADHITTSHSTHTYLNTLHHDCNKGILSAIAYMEDLWDFNEDCQYEQEKWKAD